MSLSMAPAPVLSYSGPAWSVTGLDAGRALGCSCQFASPAATPAVHGPGVCPDGTLLPCVAACSPCCRPWSLFRARRWGKKVGQIRTCRPCLPVLTAQGPLTLSHCYSLCHLPAPAQVEEAEQAGKPLPPARSWWDFLAAVRKYIVYCVTEVDTMDGHHRPYTIATLTFSAIYIFSLIWRPSYKPGEHLEARQGWQG